MSFHDGSPLTAERLRLGRMEVRGDINSRSGSRRSLETQELNMSTETDGVWAFKVDLRTQLGKTFRYDVCYC